ncbi:MAG: metallophosphoesterase [Lachnospiraceae bacterium]|nr:metallophosphoesterase [Lachnospiraceae bacterium]
MSKVFVIPDVHLKPWMFEKATELIEKNQFDRIVMLGDFVDDWNQELNLDLYKETLDAILQFIEKYPDTLYCLGNHDVSYLWQAFESGYSAYARDTVVAGINKIIYTLPKENVAFIHRIDDVLFSHAGLSEKFVMKHFGHGEKPDLDYLLEKVNKMGKYEIWDDDSPIWVRPQYRDIRMYPSSMFQVVGHTPVTKPLKTGNILTLDNFSTYSDGGPIGNEKFVCIDTEELDWEYVD